MAKSLNFIVSDSSDFSFVRALDVASCFGFKTLYPMAVTIELSDSSFFVNVKTNKGLTAHLVSPIAKHKSLDQDVEGLNPAGLFSLFLFSS